MNGYKISRSDPLHRIVIGRIYHYTVKILFGLKVRDVDCDFRLDAPLDLRPRAARAQQRRHLPRDDEEDHGRGLPDRGSAGAPLPSRVRPSRSSSISAGSSRTAVDVASSVVPAGDRRPPPARRAARPDAGREPRRAPDAIAHERRLPRVLSRPSRAHHRRPRLHRIQPRAAARRSRRGRPARRLADPRLRRQPLQHRRHRDRGCA